MATAESKRLDLYNRLEEVLGTEPATTLMTYLPPVATPELLTRTEFGDFKTEFKEFKTEMAKQFERFDRRFELMGARLDAVNKRIDRVLLTVVGSMAVVIASVFASNTFT